MSTYYQTTAKPRGRRETGPSETSSRSRAPSESSNLAKKISRTSDESISARSTNSRPNSPATFLQRHRTLDRSSLLENILPKSSSSHSLKSTEANAASEPEVSLSIHSAKTHGSTPTSPILMISKLDSRPDTQSLKSKASSKSMTDTANLDTRRSIVSPISALSSNPESDTVSSSAAQEATRTSQNSTEIANLQPSVADTSDENTPIPTPAVEQAHVLSGTAKASDVNQQAQLSPHDALSPKQHEGILQQSIQQPTQTWYPDSVPQMWHQTASPPQSPIIHQYGGFQTPGQVQYPYDYSYAYAPHMAPGGYQQYANSYYPVPFSPPTEAAPPPTAERQVSRSSSGEEQSELMRRIQSVLPDLTRLLEQSREGQALQATAEDTISQSQLEHDEQILGLKQELDATKKEYERVIRNLVDENCTLKSEAEDRQRRSRSLEGDSRGNRRLKTEFEALQAQHKDLASSVDSIRLSKEELIAEKLGVEKHIESLKKDKHIIKDSHHRAITDLKQQHLQDLATKDREHQRIAAEHKSVLNKVQLDLATLITKHTNMKKDLEIARNSETAYKASAEARLKELDAAKLNHIQQSERLKADHQRTLESLRQENKSQRLRHETEVKKHVIELEAFRTMEREWGNKSQSFETELQEHRVALATERDAHARLKIVHEERDRRTADLAGSMTLWRKKHAELQKENENLDRVLHALGFVSDVAEANPELEQPAPDSEPLSISDEKPNIPAEAMLATKQVTEVVQEVDTQPADTAVSSKQELPVMPEKEISKVIETKATLDPAKTTEPAKAAETASGSQIAKAQPAAEMSLSVKNKEGPWEIVSTRPTEKATKASAKAAQAQAQSAEDPIIFRPVHYYQVPGEFQ